MPSISPIPRLGGVRPSRIPTDQALQMTGPDGEPLVLFDNIFPGTPSGKIELKSRDLGRAVGRRGLAARIGGSARPRYPLMLISPASDKRISSTLGGLAGSHQAPPLLMNPEDAARRSLATASRYGCGTTAARSSCRSR